MSTLTKLTILFLAFSPTDLAHLELDREYAAIDKALGQTKYRDAFDLRSEWAVSRSDLHQLLSNHKPHIVHFAGHGDSTGRLLLKSASGVAEPVPTEALAELFDIISGNIRCVVLNACYTETQAQAIASAIDFVTGTSDEISDDAATEFAAGFYTGLGFGRSVKTAYRMGCNRIKIADIAENCQSKLVALRSDPAETVLIPATLQAERVAADPIAAPRPSRLTKMRRQRYQTEIEDLERQWMAVDRELRSNNDNVARDRLGLRRTQLEEDIAKAETELQALE